MKPAYNSDKYIQYFSGTRIGCNLTSCKDTDIISYDGLCIPKDGINTLTSYNDCAGKFISGEGEFFSDLSRSANRSFNSIEITICIFTDLTQKERQDYFIRIQGGVRLNQPEHIWSQNDHNLVCEIKKVRHDLLDKITCIWDTDRYNDFQLTLNIANMLNGKCPVLHSDAMTKWVNKQSKNIDYSEIYTNVKRVILQLHSVISVCTLHSKLKAPFTLDLAHWIISNDFKTPSIEIVTTFIGDIGQLILNNQYKNASQISKKYFTHLKTGAASAQYTQKVAIARLQLLTELFV